MWEWIKEKALWLWEKVSHPFRVWFNWARRKANEASAEFILADTWLKKAWAFVKVVAFNTVNPRNIGIFLGAMALVTIPVSGFMWAVSGGTFPWWCFTYLPVYVVGSGLISPGFWTVYMAIVALFTYAKLREVERFLALKLAEKGMDPIPKPLKWYHDVGMLVVYVVLAAFGLILP